jgi:Ribosomal protein L3
VQTIEAELEELKAQCKVIRVLVHTQIKKVSNWGQKKSHMLEVQVSHCATTPRPCLLVARLTLATAALHTCVHFHMALMYLTSCR